MDKFEKQLTFVRKVQFTLRCRLCLEYSGHISHLLFDTWYHTCVTSFGLQ